MARTFEEMMQGYDTFIKEQESSLSENSQNLQDEQLGFWGYVGDIAAAPFRGIEGAVQGVYNLADFLTFDALPDYDNRLLGRSSTMAGGIVEGISQFAIPFVGVGLGAASKLGQVSKVSGLLTKAEKAAGTGRKAAAIAKGRELGKFATAGAITDFAVFDAHEARLSDLIQMAPSLQNPITEYLASDEDDSEIEGRLKNAIEGLGIGGMVDVFVQSLRGFRAGMKARAEGKSAEEVMQAAQDGAVDMKGYQKVVDTREYTSSIAKSLNIGDDQATGVVSLIDSLGLSRDAIQFERFDPLVDTNYAKIGDTLIDTRNTQGLVQFKEDGTALITGFRSSDVSTGIHEVAHVARRWLLNRNLPEQARRGINEKELDRIEQWSGVKDGRWDVASEEKFARGFERYIREGKAPTKGLQGLFTKLGGWMRDIYEDVSNSSIAGEINDDFRTVMDSMLTRKGLPARPAPGSVRSLTQGQEERNTFTISYTVKESPTYTSEYREDGTRYSRKIEGGRRRGSVRIEARTEEEAKKIFNQRKRTGEFTQYEMDRRGLGGTEYPKPRVSISEINSGDSGVVLNILRQSNDDTFDLSRHINEVRAEAEALPGEVVKKTPRMRAAEIRAGKKNPVGGVVNAPRVSEDEGVMRMVARYGLEVAPAVRQTVSGGIESAVAKAKELSVTHRTITGEGSWIGHLADNPQAAASMAQDQLEEALIKATSIDMAYRKMADDMAKLVENPEGAGEDEIFKFLSMEADFRSLMNASVNIGRMEARALGNRRFVGFVDIPREPLPKELVELPPEARVVDEGTGTGRGDGEGTGTGTGVSRSDAKAARRQIIESQGDGDYATGLKRIRSRMNKVKDSIATDHAKGLAVFRKKDNMLVTYWMNAILSGPSTHLVNIASGLATTLFLPLERAIGRGIDERSLTAVHEELSTYMYLWQSVGDAFGAAKVAFKQNENLLDPNVRVMEHQPNSLATKINPDTDDMATTAKKYMASLAGAPSRFLTAEDEFFKQLNYRAHIKRDLYKQTSQDPNLRGNYRAQAEEVERQFEKMIENDQMYSQMSVIKRGNAEAANQGLEPGSPEYLDFTKDYFQKNWNENLGQIAEQARGAAREATFTTPLTKDRGMLVGVSRGVQEIVNRYPGLRFMVPFVRTPTNLLKFYLDRSPLALKEALNPEFRKSFSSDPKVRQDFYGRFATGTMGLFGTLALAKSEMITGKGPDNKHERDLLIKSGWQPYSIKDPVTGGWISYRRMDPFATFLGLAADLNEAMNAAASNGDQEASDAIMSLIPAIAIATGKNVASKSYLTGMVRVFDAVSNPTKGGKALIEQTVASFIPAAVSQTGTAFGDGDLREVQNTLDAIRSRIPGLSADLDPRRNFLGQTLQAPGQGELYNPFTYMTGGGSLVAKEIAKVGHGFQPPNAVKNGVDLRTFKNNKGQSSYDRWLELQGSVKLYGRSLEQELTRLFKSTQYKRLPETDIEGLDKSPRVAAINRVVAKYRAKAFSQMLREYPDVKRRDEIGLMIKQNRRAGRDVSQLLALIEDTR